MTCHSPRWNMFFWFDQETLPDISHRWFWPWMEISQPLSAPVSWLHPFQSQFELPEFILWLSHFCPDLWVSACTRPPTTGGWARERDIFPIYSQSPYPLAHSLTPSCRQYLGHVTDGVYLPASGPSSFPGPDWAPTGVQIAVSQSFVISSDTYSACRFLNMLMHILLIELPFHPQGWGWLSLPVLNPDYLAIS